MRVVVVVEKPFVAKNVVAGFQALNPQSTFVFVTVWPIGLLQPALPRGLRWEDFPHIDGRYEFPDVPRSDRLSSSNLLEPDGENGLTRRALSPPWNEACLALQQADQVVVVWSPNSSLAHADAFLRFARGKGLQRGETRLLTSFCTEAQKQLHSAPDAATEQRIEALVEAGRVRQYFNHQFTLNSLAILSKALQPRTGWVSKYQLQLLLHLAEQPPMTQGRCLVQMNRWAGTGRYPSQGEGLGSAISQVAILEQLIEKGWWSSTDPSQPKALWALTRLGQEAVAKIHPKCKDTDLPFRLTAWSQQGLVASRPAMDRYLRTFFGRQKRYPGSFT